MTTLVPQTLNDQIESSNQSLVNAQNCTITKEILDTITINGCENMEFYEYSNLVEPVIISQSDKAKVLLLSSSISAHLNPPPDETSSLKKDKRNAMIVIVILFAIVIGLLSYIYSIKGQKTSLR